MILLTYLCFFIIGGYIWAWCKNNPHENPLGQNFPWGSIVVFAGIGLVCYIPTIRIDYAAYKAGKSASSIVGEKVSYQCGSMLNTFFDRNTDSAAGYVKRTVDGGHEKKSKLRHEVCSGLVDMLSDLDLSGNTETRRGKIFAVHVISHEARHMVGQGSEAAAECEALQRNALFVKALGGSESVANALAIGFYKEMYLHRDTSSDYFSSECKKGGAMDENLPTSPWNLPGF